METKIKGDKIKEGSILPEALGFDSFPMQDEMEKPMNKNTYTCFTERLCFAHMVIAYVTPETSREEDICQLIKGMTCSFGGILFSPEYCNPEYIINNGTDEFTRITLHVSEDADGIVHVNLRSIENPLNLDFKIPITYAFPATNDNKLPVTLQNSPYDYYRKNGGKLFKNEDAYIEYMVAGVDYVGNPVVNIPTYTNIEAFKEYSWKDNTTKPLTMNWFYGIVHNHSELNGFVHININGEDLTCEVGDAPAVIENTGVWHEFVIGDSLSGELYIDPNKKTFIFAYE